MSQSSVWQPYRQRRWRLLWTALAGLAALGCSLVLAGHRHSAFPCPKCGKPFSHTDEFRDGFTKVCVHCKHPKWSEA